MKIYEKEISGCENCPYSTMTRAYAPASFDNVLDIVGKVMAFNVTCTKLNRSLAEYWEAWDGPIKIPNDCVLRNKNE